MHRASQPTHQSASQPTDPGSRHAGPDTIVVGIDGTEDGLRAVDYAADEACVSGSRLLLMHVLLTAPGRMSISTSAQEAVRRAAARAVEMARARAELAGVPSDRVDVHVTSGPVTGSLLAATKTAGLMVLGRRGISGLDRLFAGSTSSSVAARAACPVVVVPHAWSAGATRGVVAVGVDGSARSMPALTRAVAEAHVRAASLTVVHAWEPPSPYYVDMAEIQDMIDAWRDRAERGVSEQLASLTGNHPGLMIDREYVSRHPIEALVAQSAESDLLVIGTRGGGGIKGLALGSVARAVVAGSSCPVMLVRRGRATADSVRDSRGNPRAARPATATSTV